MSLNIEFPNSQHVTPSSPLSNVEPNFVTNEHSNTVYDLNRYSSELLSTSSSSSSDLVLPSQNVHSIQTRSKSVIHQPRPHPWLFLAHCEPKTIKQALTDPQWFAAMKQEYKALLQNKTSNLVPLPKYKQVVHCKWVFIIKKNVDGIVNKFKARLVAKGFH